MTTSQSGAAISQLHINGRFTLGHESVETTQIYLSANLALKEKALSKTMPCDGRTPARYRADDKLLAFLADL